ncbi:hypothetical protein NDU88_000348 [Pleurodeles waltl]|uniref:Basic proline-rich protein-like n=1 Tax=Pleurodeles waltl TaxID=8319 RepID=A0AAV7R5Q6_PLEWA|nr:hypothetical protein NDU88_000348 [Pleurodeles waltl]
MLLGLLRCLSSQGSSGRAQLPGRLTFPTWRRPGPRRRSGGSSCPPFASRCTPSVLLCQGGPPIGRPDPPSRAGNPLSRTPCLPRQGPSAPPGLPPIRSSVQGSQTRCSWPQLPPPELRMGGERARPPAARAPVNRGGARAPDPLAPPPPPAAFAWAPPPTAGSREGRGATSGSGSGPGGSTATTRSRRGGRTPLHFTARLAVTAQRQVPGPGIRRAQATPPGVFAPGPADAQHPHAGLGFFPGLDCPGDSVE